jgi:hypothetical protein
MPRAGPTVDEDMMHSISAPHRRTRHGRRGRRGPRMLAATAGLALLLAACAGGTPDGAPSPAPSPVPAPSGPSAPVEPAPTAVVAVHLVRSGPTDFFLEPVPVRVPEFGDAPVARVTAAIDALLKLTDPDDPELFTSVPPGTTLSRASVDGGVVNLDLSGGIVGSSGGSAQELTFAQQLAHTARVDASITAVVLLIDGQPITELWGHLDWSDPIEVDPFILSPVTITAPLAGEDVPVGAVTFRGEATVFEATVLVTLLDAEGDLLAEGFVTATTGAPERGTWEWTVELPEVGEYTVVAAESDPSDGEGRPPFSTTRTFRATG